MDILKLYHLGGADHLGESLFMWLLRLDTDLKAHN